MDCQLNKFPACYVVREESRFQKNSPEIIIHDKKYPVDKSQLQTPSVQKWQQWRVI